MPVAEILCPAKTCRQPGALRGTWIVCKANHHWLPTTDTLRCPKCQTLGTHIQLKDADTVACSNCGKPWVIGRIAVVDKISVVLVKGSSSCDSIMRAVDSFAGELLKNESLDGAIKRGETSLAEIVDRFRRNLHNGRVG